MAVILWLCECKAKVRVISLNYDFVNVFKMYKHS